MAGKVNLNLHLVSDPKWRRAFMEAMPMGCIIPTNQGPAFTSPVEHVDVTFFIEYLHKRMLSFGIENPRLRDIKLEIEKIIEDPRELITLWAMKKLGE